MDANAARELSPLGIAIRYDDEGHLYLWKGRKMAVSVTDDLFEMYAPEAVNEFNDWQPAQGQKC